MMPSMKDKWFEDYKPDEKFTFGDHLVTEKEIIDFANLYDPQSFHIDPTAAEASSFGGLIASGWMTSALLMRMMCDHFISSASAMGSPGIDHLRWIKPVRPGDRIHARITVIKTQLSRSKPDRGLITLRQEVINQNGEVVMSLEGMAMLRCRPKN
jgi:acyl dehydratase